MSDDRIAQALIGLAQEAQKAERELDQAIGERDDAEEALSQAYFLVTGHSPQWSNNFGQKEALEEIDDACSAMRAEIERLRAALTAAGQGEMAAYPSESAMRAAGEMEIAACLGSATTLRIAQLIQKAIDASAGQGEKQNG